MSKLTYIFHIRYNRKICLLPSYSKWVLYSVVCIESASTDSAELGLFISTSCLFAKKTSLSPMDRKALSFPVNHALDFQAQERAESLVL